MVKAIIFDLQGTLIENGVFPSPIRQVKNILRIDSTYQEYIPLFERIFMTKKFENLSVAFKAVAEAFSVDPPDFIFEKLVGVWNKNKLLSRLFLDTVPTLEILKGKYKLILVANIDSSSKDVIDRFKLHDFFDKIYLSCDTGILKNDEEFYSMLLEENQLSKEDVVVVGDSMDSDIKSAKNSELRAILIDRNNRMEYEDKILSLEELESKISK